MYFTTESIRECEYEKTPNPFWQQKSKGIPNVYYAITHIKKAVFGFGASLLRGAKVKSGGEKLSQL
jgi:hypothetical protein